MNMNMEITAWIYNIFNPCSHYEKLIVSTCYGETDEKELIELQHHIQHCHKCKEKYDNLIEFTHQLNQIQNTLNTSEVLEDINLLPSIINTISARENTSPLFHPGLKLAYTLGIICLVFLSTFTSIYVLKDKENVKENSASFASLSKSTKGAPSSYEGPLERQKDKLREIIKTNSGQSIAGQALLLLADLEYTSSEHYEEAYRLYSQLRDKYPHIFTSTPEAVYRYNLLEETKKENFKPLYALNSALSSSDNPIKHLEKIIASYPGTMVANLAVNSMIDCFMDSNTAHNSERTIKALENIRGYLTEPTAIAQVNYVLGNLYWNQMRDFEKARTFFQSVIHSDAKQLHPLANEALTQLVSMPE